MWRRACPSPFAARSTDRDQRFTRCGPRHHVVGHQHRFGPGAGARPHDDGRSDGRGESRRGNRSAECGRCRSRAVGARAGSRLELGRGAEGACDVEARGRVAGTPIDFTRRDDRSRGSGQRSLLRQGGRMQRCAGAGNDRRASMGSEQSAVASVSALLARASGPAPARRPASVRRCLDRRRCPGNRWRSPERRCRPGRGRSIYSASPGRGVRPGRRTPRDRGRSRAGL